VLGWIAATGWMLATLDNLRAGLWELAPLGLHLGRGWRLFVVLFAYGLVLGVVADVLAVPGFIVASAYHDTPAALAGVFLVIAGGGLAVLGLVAISTLLLPAIVTATDRGGVRQGLAVPGIVAAVRTQPQPALVAGLLLVVAYALQSAGSLACGVGMVFTLGYSPPLMAAVLNRYEGEAGRTLGGS